MKSIAVGYAEKAIRGGMRLGRSLVRAPLEREARRLVPEATRRGSGMCAIAEDDGYTKFRASELSGADGAIPALRERAEAWKSEAARVRDEMPKNILASDDLFAHRAILDLALHDEILAGVTAYFGQLPRLYNLYVWWSPPNQTAVGSQLYHYDHRDSRQAKLFINLADVTEASGPLHFLTAKDSRAVDARVGYSQDRYTDEQVYGAVPRRNVIPAVGEAGSAYIVDTARCLHYGSRGNSIDRFILMASFARVNSVNPGKGCRVLDPVRKRIAAEMYDGDPVRGFVLTSPK